MALETLISEMFSKSIQGHVQSMLSTALSNLNTHPIHHYQHSDIYLSTLAHSMLKVVFFLCVLTIQIKQIEEEFHECVPVLNWHPLYEPIYGGHWNNYLHIEIKSIIDFLKEEVDKDLQVQQKKKFARPFTILTRIETRKEWKESKRRKAKNLVSLVDSLLMNR